MWKERNKRGFEDSWDFGPFGWLCEGCWGFRRVVYHPCPFWLFPKVSTSMHAVSKHWFKLQTCIFICSRQGKISTTPTLLSALFAFEPYQRWSWTSSKNMFCTLWWSQWWSQVTWSNICSMVMHLVYAEFTVPKKIAVGSTWQLCGRGAVPFFVKLQYLWCCLCLHQHQNSTNYLVATPQLVVQVKLHHGMSLTSNWILNTKMFRKPVVGCQTSVWIPPAITCNFRSKSSSTRTVMNGLEFLLSPNCRACTQSNAVHKFGWATANRLKLLSD